MRRAALILVSLVALIVFAGNASGEARVPGAGGSLCKTGFKPAVVDRAFACLKAGQACSAKHQSDYTRSGLSCKSGRLRVIVAGTTRSASSPGASRANPVPLGRWGALGNGWKLTVTEVNLDAASASLAADTSNSLPLLGFQYVLVAVSATYDGSGSSHLTPGSSLRSIGALNIVRTSSNSYCGKLPSPDLDTGNPLVFHGGKISGYAVCWMVLIGDVSGLEMYYQPPLSNTQVWFALH